MLDPAKRYDSETVQDEPIETDADRTDRDTELLSPIDTNEPSNEVEVIVQDL